MLVIKDLHASVEGKEILCGINLTINAGEVHAIMGAQRFREKHFSQCAGRKYQF